jgi:hypothetical protein
MDFVCGRDVAHAGALSALHRRLKLLPRRAGLGTARPEDEVSRGARTRGLDSHKISFEPWQPEVIARAPRPVARIAAGRHARRAPSALQRGKRLFHVLAERVRVR